MASVKKIGFYWGEENITVVEFEKNAPTQVVSSSLDVKANTSSPFSSNLTEEIKISSILQKVLQKNRITVGSFCVSLPMKEIILRSFIIPFVKQEDLQNVIKFEAKKYLPIDVQYLTYVFYTIPFTENKIKRLQVIFFAVRKETLDRYERIFKQVNAVVSYCEPCVVSLAKVLLFKKEINPTDHLAFLTIDKNLGRICFIDQGIPQFVREFPISPQSSSEEAQGSMATLNLRIVNEVGNSLDFYARQFSGDRVNQMLVSSEGADQDLFNALESELKLKVRKVSPVLTMGAVGQGNDVDVIHAMGACVEPPMETLSGFNFIDDSTSKLQFKTILNRVAKEYKESMLVFLLCGAILIGAGVFFQLKLKTVQQQYDQLSRKEGPDFTMSLDYIKSDKQQYSDQLTAYKNIEAKSDMVLILMRIASHLPRGTMLSTLTLINDQSDPQNKHVIFNMSGQVFGEDPTEEIAVVNQITSDLRNDKILSRFVQKVNLVNFNRVMLDGRQSTDFNIRSS